MATSDVHTSMPANAYAILGLVSFGEISGYDLKRFADRSIHHFFWSPSASQVYSELRRLESMGCVTERRVAQRTRPDKRMYRITAQGRKELRKWLDHPDADLGVRKSTFLLKLFFRRDTSYQVAIDQLLARSRQLEQTLAEYEQIERDFEDVDDWLFPYLVLQAGLAKVNAEIEWISGALDVLRARLGGSEGRW